MAHNFKYFIIVFPQRKYEFLSDIKFIWFNRVKPGRYLVTTEWYNVVVMSYYMRRLIVKNSPLITPIFNLLTY